VVAEMLDVPETSPTTAWLDMVADRAHVRATALPPPMLPTIKKQPKARKPYLIPLASLQLDPARMTKEETGFFSTRTTESDSPRAPVARQVDAPMPRDIAMRRRGGVASSSLKPLVVTASNENGQSRDRYERQRHSNLSPLSGGLSSTAEVPQLGKGRSNSPCRWRPHSSSLFTMDGRPHTSSFFTMDATAS